MIETNKPAAGMVGKLCLRDLLLLAVEVAVLIGGCVALHHFMAG